MRFFLEFLRGFGSFAFDQPCVTVLGSARFEESNRYYRIAREAGGLSVGCNISLPREQKPNACLDRPIQFDHSSRTRSCS